MNINNSLKPTINYSGERLIVRIPEIYSFPECWELFMVEIPKMPEFHNAKALAIDFSLTNEITELGMSSEAIYLLDRFFEKNNGGTYIIGINENFKNIYSHMCKEQLNNHKLIEDDQGINLV